MFEKQTHPDVESKNIMDRIPGMKDGTHLALSWWKAWSCQAVE